MKTPPLLTGTALVFWGWHSGLLTVSIVMALVLEAARLIRYRWNLTPSDFNRVSDLCSLLLAGLVIYVYATSRSAAAILVIVQRLPLVVFPLLVAQAFSFPPLHLLPSPVSSPDSARPGSSPTSPFKYRLL